MADIKISQMTAGTPDENTLFEGSLDGGGGVYNTRSVSASALATLLNTTMQYGGLSTTDDTIVGSINEVAKDHNVSDEYDSTQTYVVGDLCIYGNNLFECNTDITIPEPFDSNKWTLTTLDAVIPRDANDIPYSAGVSVADKLDNVPTLVSGTVSVSSGVTMKGVQLYKYGRVVYFRAEIKVTSPSNWQIVATIPSGYIPAESVYSVMDKTANMTGTLTAHIHVENNGNVGLANALPDANSEYRFAMTWIV